MINIKLYDNKATVQRDKVSGIIGSLDISRDEAISIAKQEKDVHIQIMEHGWISIADFVDIKEICTFGVAIDSLGGLSWVIIQEGSRIINRGGVCYKGEIDKNCLVTFNTLIENFIIGSNSLFNISNLVVDIINRNGKSAIQHVRLLRESSIDMPCRKMYEMNDNNEAVETALRINMDGEIVYMIADSIVQAYV